MKALLKIIVVLALLGGVGFFVFKYYIADNSTRACGRMATLCGAKTGPRAEANCQHFFAKLESAGGKETIKRTNTCINESKTCTAALGCLVGGLGNTLKSKAGEFIDGVKRSLE
jgi:hypothetical protein